jgi:molybdate transport system substrate-binding protein
MNGRPVAVAVVMLLAAVACRATPEPPAAPLRVFSSNGVRELLQDVRPELERAAGRPLQVEFSTAASLTRRIDAGDVPDVAVLTNTIVDQLAARGVLAAAGRRDVARVGVGVGVRSDAPARDIATPEAFTALLLEARSITFTAEGQSRAAIDRAFDRLGITDQVKAKTILKGPGEAPGVVAKGEAEVVLTLVSEMVAVPGLKVLGPFPAELQQHVTFTAAPSATAPDPDAAGRVVQALTGPAAASKLAGHGLEAAPPR